MQEDQAQKLLARIENLEKIVDELQRKLAEKPAAQTPEVRQSTPSAKPTEPPKTTTTARLFSKAQQATVDQVSGRRSEYWLNRFGIGLLLFGLVFLFKYSIDQGWLTPQVRVGFGLVLGALLITQGLRKRQARPMFGQILIGGGIATFYITGFAAFQFYSLISHPAAFAFMVAVTALAFLLAVRENGTALAVIGLLGGLGTPFLLYTGESNLPGLIAYTCLILTGGIGIFLRKGWLSLLWVCVLGGWGIIATAADNLSPMPENPGDHWAVQAGIVFCWLVFWAIPLLREILIRQSPSTAMRPDKADEPSPPRRYAALSLRSVQTLSFSSPLLALFLSMLVWPLTDTTWGWIALAGSAIYAGVASSFRGSSEARSLGHLQATVALVLFTESLALLLHGDVLLLALSAEAAALHISSRRLAVTGQNFIAHALFALVAVWLIIRLGDGQEGAQVVFNAQAMSDIGAIACAFAATFFLSDRSLGVIYRVAIHLGVLAWFAREFANLPNGSGYITIAWGIYSITLMIIGLRTSRVVMQKVALATLVLVIAKMFLVDLANVEAIWRVLLFLGMGGVLLLISNFFQKFWRQDAAKNDAENKT